MMIYCPLLVHLYHCKSFDQTKLKTKCGVQRHLVYDPETKEMHSQQMPWQVPTVCKSHFLKN